MLKISFGSTLEYGAAIEEDQLFKDIKMLQRQQDIMKLPEQERSSILLTLDHFIKESKINLI